MASRDEKSVPLFGLIIIALLVRLMTCRFLSVDDQDTVTLDTSKLPEGSLDMDHGTIPEEGVLAYYDIETQESPKFDPTETAENGNISNTFKRGEKENLLRFLNSGLMRADDEKYEVNQQTTKKADIKDDNTLLPPGIHVPKYMLDLYNNFKSQTWMLSDTVRSYSNINGDNYENQDAYDNSLGNQRGSETRVHTLTFHIAALKNEENLDGAELRIHTLIARDRNAFMGVDRLVTVFLVTDTQDGEQQRQILDSKHVYEKSNAFETFNVTSAVDFWLKNTFVEQLVEIRIESIFSSVGNQGTMDISTNPYVETEPLLLVYSSNNKLGSGESSRNATFPSAHKLSKRNIDTEEEEEESNVIAEEVAKTRNKRKRHRNPCRRRPLFVNFADINYDTWIIAPRGYEAFECTGKCYFPLSDHLTPSQHAIVQTLLHTLAPKKAPRACCVPTKLDSISILYLDADGVVTYKYRHEDMVVVECGCR